MSRTASLRALARRVDERMPRPGHSDRVGVVAAAIAARVGWTPADVELVAEAGELHDVGLICVPEEVLARQDERPDARAAVELHADIGAGMAATVLTREQSRWIRHHHERWDGSGYPARLRGEAIPMGAAILAAAEACEEVSGSSVGAKEMIDEIQRLSGTRIAPWAVTAFVDLFSRGRLPLERAMD